MTKKSKSKIGAGAIILRVVVIVLVMVLGGIGSFVASKAFFTSRLSDAKKEKLAQQVKEASKERVDSAMMQVGDNVVLRVYHNKNQQMIFIPLRPDLSLKLDSDGKDKMGASKATIKDFFTKTKSSKSLCKQIENTFDVKIDSYERFSDRSFVKLFNRSGEEISINLDQAVSFVDNTGKDVTLPVGENALNGNEALALLTDETAFASEDQHMETVGDMVIEMSQALGKGSLSKYKEFVTNYYDYAKSNFSYGDVSSRLERVHGIKNKDYNYILLSGTSTTDGYKISSDDKKSVKEIFAENGDVGKTIKSSSTSSKGTKTDTKEKTTGASDSKGISIEIQNSTNITGLAGNWKEKLVADGFTVGSVLTNREGALTRTKIIVAKEGMGQDLKAYFKNPEFVVGNVSSGAEICIIVGTEDNIQ